MKGEKVIVTEYNHETGELETTEYTERFIVTAFTEKGNMEAMEHWSDDITSKEFIRATIYLMEDVEDDLDTGGIL